MKAFKCFKILIIFCLLLNSCSNPPDNKQKSISILESVGNDTLNVVKGIFDIPELDVNPSPSVNQSFTFPKSENVIDYDVSPAGVNVAALIQNSENRCFIKFWQIGRTDISDVCALPEALKANAITWHPKTNALFVLGVKDAKYRIFRIEKNSTGWASKSIFSSSSQLRRLVACPRPFITTYKNGNSYYSYRLFLGMDNGDQTYRIVSITEYGERFYQVIGPEKTFSNSREYSAGADPSTIKAAWALPIAFHPAGHQLIWEDQNHNFFVAKYDSRYWGDSKPIKFGISKNGSITPSPNGLGILHWQNKKSGIGVYLFMTKKESNQLSEYQFTSTPSSVPDGKGIVGLTNSNGQFTLNYLPIEMPLPDVVDAWMFVRSFEEVNLFQKYFGLFRLHGFDQLYNLYETENYFCNSYDRTAPARPYLVTTDIFWELFGAAYQGLFIVKERDEAIPNFWKFINQANSYLKSANKKSSWIPIFTVLSQVYSGNYQSAEAKRIQKEEDCYSEIIDTIYKYSDLKPRGHYTSSPEMERYFKAFRYFTTIYKSKPNILKELNSLPKEIRAYAEKWIEGYSGFVAPSRSNLVWKNVKNSIPAYCQYPVKDLTVFPLSWGFDNEILFSTVYQLRAPKDLQIAGNEGFRLLPSGLDLAAAIGNGFAENLLEPEIQKYPPLKKVIENLRSNFKNNVQNADLKDNLYNKWINAIAVQWADTINSTNGLKDRPLWQTKRLQTGLATWATLRHATILVNERTSAECGEGGFEDILMRAPRGFVEPDPYTFASIADLFETAVKFVSGNTAQNSDIIDYESREEPQKRSLYDGIVKRLKEAAQDARAFQVMAEKERRGEQLTNEENEKILYVGRIAEHLFLLFNSLSNKDYALSTPDPIAKIADVAGDGEISPYLMAAVGRTIEWNYIVPFFGRHQIVKGAIYSYYEFPSKQILNDKEWREKVNSQEITPWIKPYIANQAPLNQPDTQY